MYMQFLFAINRLKGGEIENYVNKIWYNGWKIRKGSDSVKKTIRARFSKGMIEPLEKLDLEEGKEILVTIRETSLEDRFLKAAGAWKGTIDAEKLIEDIYRDRLLMNRPEPEL